MGSHGRTSYTSNMFSLKLVLCVCIFFVIGMEAAPKPQPKAEPKPQPKAEPKPQPKAEPKPFPPGGFNFPGVNPGPRNWNRFQMNRKILDEYPASVTVSSSGPAGKKYPELR